MICFHTQSFIFQRDLYSQRVELNFFFRIKVVVCIWNIDNIKKLNSIDVSTKIASIYVHICEFIVKPPIHSQIVESSKFHSIHCGKNRVENYYICRKHISFWKQQFFFSFSVIAKRLISIKFPLRKIKWFYLSYHIDCMLDCHTSYCIFHRYIHRNLIHKSIVFPFFSRPLLPLMQRLTRPISLPVWWCFFFLLFGESEKKIGYINARGTLFQF